MLAEKFFLVLETLKSHASDGSPVVVSTARHIPIKSDVRRGLSIPCELPPSQTMLLPLRIEHAQREAPAPVTQKAQHRQKLAVHARRLGMTTARGAGSGPRL